MRGYLPKHKDQRAPIRVAVVGTGTFGTDMIAAMAVMPEIRIVAAVDLLLDRALQACDVAELSAIVAETAEEAAKVTASDKVVVFHQSDWLTGLEVDVVVEATGMVESGARVAWQAITQGRHVVMVNAEADACVGPILARLARRAGVVYTLAEGDQPSLIVQLVRRARILGLEVVCAGKGTRFLPDLPQVAWPAGKRSDISFADGTKSFVELVCVSNCTGLVPDVRGLHRPRMSTADVPQVLIPRQDGGLLSHNGVVDLVNCADEQGAVREDARDLVGGVFVIVRAATLHLRRRLSRYAVALSDDGQYALLLRPYHLVGLEAPWSVLSAALWGQPTAIPQSPVAEAVAVAKRDLRAGERLDGIGGEMVRGEIEAAHVAQGTDLLPVGLTEGVLLRRDVATGQTLSYADVEPPVDSVVWSLRGLQDNTC